jgi:hypothetical protein
LELHEDNQTTLSSCSNKFDNQYQVLIIIEDNSEEFDDNNNPILNLANITRGANHLAIGDTAAKPRGSKRTYASSNNSRIKVSRK